MISMTSLPTQEVIKKPPSMSKLNSARSSRTRLPRWVDTAPSPSLCFSPSMLSQSLLRPFVHSSFLRTTSTLSRFSKPPFRRSTSKCMTTRASAVGTNPKENRSVHTESSRPASESQESSRPLRKADIIDVIITRIGYGGASVGRITNAPFMQSQDFDLPVYAPKGSCVGDVIQCTVTRVRRRGSRPNNLPVKPPPDVTPPDAPVKSYVEVNFTSLITPSPLTQPVPCKHFGPFHLGGGGCGGCSSMQMAYDLQLKEKGNQMKTLFSPFIENDPSILKQIVPCKNTLNYRNKMEFSYGKRWHINPPGKSTSSSRSQSSFGDNDESPSEQKPKILKDDSDYALGLHVPQRYDKIIEINECHIQLPIGNEILQVIREMAEKMLLEPYDSRKNVGYLRNIGIRTSTNASGSLEIMVNVITSPCDVPERLVPLAETLASKFPEIVCVVQNIRGARGSSFQQTDEESERLLFGERPYIQQSLCGTTFRISANSFFQTNPEQASVLFNEVRKAAQLSRHDTLLDLFCGTGTIGLSLARDAKHVFGVDLVASAIKDAQVNAFDNGVYNATFLQTNLDKLKEARRKESFSLPQADVVVVDPPRAGLHPELIRYLAVSNAKRIVYVSCNPMTQVRDIMELRHASHGAFTVSNLQPVDMFPNTHHVECVATIERL